MLFNSYEFIFFFLPCALFGFFSVCRFWGIEAGIKCLAFASLFFYGWWNPIYLLLIAFSILFNYSVGGLFNLSFQGNVVLKKKLILAVGISCNLGLLAYFKYANFFVENVNYLTGMSLTIDTIILPLAISFFTFQQIAYLVDAYSGLVRDYKFSHYVLFVTFFPQLIAGPIVHHKQMLPQFMRSETLKPQIGNISLGATIFCIGLFKKAVLADGIAQYATPVFNAAQAGETLTFFEAWGGALAYTFQLYFDFSGYSDMAIGAALMFGIRLPMNFFSPYKSTSIVEFWRRWHITLSTFLRDYVYIPLGGSRNGKTRRYANLMTTMLLGGLWHGAGWTFVVWGALHGFYLVINHAWRWVCERLGWVFLRKSKIWRFFAWGITFLAVVVGWVFFRAESFEAAITMLQGMVGMNGVAIPNGIAARLGENVQTQLKSWGIEFYLGGGMVFVMTYLWVIALMLIAVIAPNTLQLMRHFKPTVDEYKESEGGAFEPFVKLTSKIAWKPTVLWACCIALLGGLGILALTSVSEFLYFQF